MKLVVWPTSKDTVSLIAIAHYLSSSHRNDFKESDLVKIAEALDCTYSASFTMNDTGECI